MYHFYVSHDALFWNSQAYLVNDSIYDFHWKSASKFHCWNVFDTRHYYNWNFIAEKEVRNKHGEGFDYNLHCWIYNGNHCIGNATKHNRTFEEEPACQPRKQKCTFSYRYCQSSKFVDPESRNATWLNGLVS